jgi:hypothetical protein
LSKKRIVTRSMASIREAYTNPDVEQGDFYSAQQIRYREVEPNRFLPENMKASVGPGITDDTLSQFNTYDPYTERVSNKFSTAGLSQLLQGQATTTNEETYCRGFTGAAGVATLLSDQASKGTNPIRCGWRYKKSPGGGLPLVSQGALGTPSGPLNAQADSLGNGVEWIWDLKKAQDRHARDFVATLPASAAGLNTAQQSFSNAAWCSQTNRYIFVDQAGIPLPGYTCGQGNVVTSPANFPQPPTTSATTMASANTSVLSSCMRPGNNQSLSRECLLLAVKNNGCSSDGALYQAIEGASPSSANFSQNLQAQPAFKAYQSKQGDNRITEDLFNKERASWDMATREIQKLQRYTQTAQDPYAKIAAEDLCLQSGKFDQYDFCSDITDSTAITSVDLKCMQGYWQEKNGKPAGLLYPTARELKPELGAIRTWGEYRSAIDGLKTKVNSTNPLEQRAAINNFLGVRVSNEPFSPLNLDNFSQQFSLSGQPLVFWLDAADPSSLTIDQNSRVRDWNDKSGRNNTVTQTSLLNRPMYKREAFYGVEFDGTGAFLPIPNAAQFVAGNNFTVFVVEKRKSSKGNNFFLGGTVGARNNNLVLGYVIPNLIRFAFFANDVDGRVPNYQQSLEPTRVWAFEKTPTGRAIYLNGERLSSDNNMEVLQNWIGAAVGRFGGDYYQGILHEILIFNPGLASERRQKIEGYLAHKWGQSTGLVSGHPYKTSSP